MTTRDHAGKIQIALSALTLCLLTACSHSPSEGEAKDVVKSRLVGCKYISLEKFDRVNGIPIDDNDYRVDVKYTIRMSPDGDMKDYTKQWKDEYQKYQAMKADADRKRNDFLARKDAYADANATDPFARDTFETQNKDESQAVLNEGVEVGNTAFRLSENSPAKFYQTRIRQACPTVSYRILSSFFDRNSDLSDDVDVEFTETLAMIKTDNGWQLAR